MLGRELQPAGFGQVRRIDFGDHGATGEILQRLFGRPKAIVSPFGPDDAQAAVIEAKLLQTRCKQRGLRRDPQDMPQCLVPADQSGQETCCSAKIAMDFMKSAPGQSLAWQELVDQPDPGRHRRHSNPACGAGDAGHLAAELLNRGRLKHAPRDTPACDSSQYVLLID